MGTIRTEKQIAEERLQNINETIDLIIRLAGNNQAAEEVLRHGGTEADYNQKAFALDADAVIGVLGGLKTESYYLSNEIEFYDRKEKESNK